MARFVILRSLHPRNMCLNTRLGCSYHSADIYSVQFYSHSLSTIARTFSFILGALLGTLVLFALVDDNILLTASIIPSSIPVNRYRFQYKNCYHNYLFQGYQ